MFLAKTPNAIKRTLRSLVWNIPNKTNTIYLTFDDGPTPEITEWVLNELEKHQIPATFFVVGNNVEKHPEIVKAILAKGHKIGNHTQHHLNGWKSKTANYLADVAKCQDLVKSKLFRPPYGRIKNTQIRKLKLAYDIIMWDVLSGDFDQKITPETCVNNVLVNTVPGSIIVFHDSVKAEKNLKASLPIILTELKAKGFQFAIIP